MTVQNGAIVSALRSQPREEQGRAPRAKSDLEAQSEQVHPAVA